VKSSAAWNLVRGLKFEPVNPVICDHGLLVCRCEELQHFELWLLHERRRRQAALLLLFVALEME
jgi:hypothetical protein